MSSYILPSILTLGLLWVLLFLVWVAYYVTHNGGSLFDEYDFWGALFDFIALRHSCSCHISIFKRHLVAAQTNLETVSIREE